MKVNLDGTSQAVQTTTSSGTYSFGGLHAGSYSVRPTLNGCSFLPDVVNLNNLTASAVQNFAGSGSACGGNPAVNTGATSGTFVISGTVRDSGNHPLVGVMLTLGGSTQALRFSDIAGSYAFHVNKGTYSLAASGACTLTPANVNFNNLAANQVQNFTATTTGCVTSKPIEASQAGAVFLLAQNGATLGETFVALEPRSSNASAIARLQEIGTEASATTRSVTIAGLPAIERQATLNKVVDHNPVAPRLWLTTAIATGTTVVRLDTQLDPAASAATINMFFDTARNFTTDTLSNLHGPALPTVPAAAPVAPAAKSPHPVLFPNNMASTFGEIVVAADDSTDGTASHVVYASNPAAGANSTVLHGANGGGFPAPSTVTRTNTAFTSGLGDPGLAVGAPNTRTLAASGYLPGTQAFYYSELDQSSNTAAAIVVFRSIDGGATFTETNNVPIDCTATGTCQVPDQPQLAAGRQIQSTTGDLLYMAWRHYNNGNSVIGVSCSNDGGNTWSAPDTTTIPAAGDFPRTTVAPDGSYYLSYETGQGSGSYSYYVQKYAPCNMGFGRASDSPFKIAGGIKEVATLPGPDRPESFGPYMIAADDTDSNGNRVFAVYVEEVSSNNALGNDNIRVAESTTGGTSWKVATNPLNSSLSGHRFAPWVCSTNGNFYATWYDRRDATSSQPDLTGYFYGTFDDKSNTGTPSLAASNVNAGGGSSFDDQQCLSGFYSDVANSQGTNTAGVIESGEETLCTDLPAVQLNAGNCSSCPNDKTQICGSRTPCDFRSPNCTSGEKCVTGSGKPKYGDYNGAACAGGALFMAWASATPPQGIVCAVAGAPCQSIGDCCEGSFCTTAGFCSVDNGPLGNGQACSKFSDCASFNCFGGTCLPSVALYINSTLGSAAGPMSCTDAGATPDESVGAPFEFDTGEPPLTAIGNGYGINNGCFQNFLVDVDMTQPGFVGQGLFVAGRWSDSLTACDEMATMTVFVTADNVNWQMRDLVQYSAQPEPNGGCHAQALSHTDQNSKGLGGTSILPSENLQHVRVAITAVEGGVLAPINISGVTNN